ncbi:MAG: hypothetical protein ABI037_12915 [Gemmatimonadales bacterium]
MKYNRSYLFVDESGVAELGPHGDAHGQYLGLLGCVTSQREYWREIEPAMASFKRRQFPGCDPAKIALHRAHIVGKQGVFGVLKDAARRAAFDEDMLRLYAELPYFLIGIVVDKLAHARHPQRFYENSYHWALAMMLERYCGLLRVWGRTGKVICEARGKYPDRLLQGAYEQVLEKGTPHRRHPAAFFKEVLTSRKIKFLSKIPATAGLEIADGLVRTAKLEILAENGKAERLEHPFQVAVEGAIGGKWNRRWSTGKVAGYGKAFFTLPDQG